MASIFRFRYDQLNHCVEYNLEKSQTDTKIFQLGKTFGLIRAGADYEGFLAAIHAYLVYCAHVGIYWELHPIIFKIVSFLPSRGETWLLKFGNQQVASRLREAPREKLMASSDDKAFLSQVLEL